LEKCKIYDRLKLYLGCSGWSYTSWQGPFYPQNMENRAWLPYYSQIFNYVEIDSTFYNIPSEIMVKNWASRIDYNCFNYCSTCELKYPKQVLRCNDCNQKVRIRPWHRSKKADLRRI
jgi:hypothetical protein